MQSVHIRLRPKISADIVPNAGSSGLQAPPSLDVGGTVGPNQKYQQSVSLVLT